MNRRGNCPLTMRQCEKTKSPARSKSARPEGFLQQPQGKQTNDFRLWPEFGQQPAQSNRLAGWPALLPLPRQRNNSFYAATWLLLRVGKVEFAFPGSPAAGSSVALLCLSTMCSPECHRVHAFYPEWLTLARQIGKKCRLPELVVTGQKKGIVDSLQ